MIKRLITIACASLSILFAGQVLAGPGGCAVGASSRLIGHNGFAGCVTPPNNPPPIPTLTNQQSFGGIGSEPQVLDLSTGQGLTMTACLTRLLNQDLGGGVSFTGQSRSGMASFSWNGTTLSFYPLQAWVLNESRPLGLYFTSINPIDAVTDCGGFSLGPALFDLHDFGTLMQQLGTSATIDSQGTIALILNGKIYILRPDFQVTGGGSGGPSLTPQADGSWKFVDSAGNVQILHPAFADPQTLHDLLSALGGTAVVGVNGTVSLTLNGLKYVLVPDPTLGPVLQTSAWWQSGPAHFTFVDDIFIYSDTAQGFTMLLGN